MADPKKPLYEESVLQALDQSFQFSTEILGAIEAFRANSPGQSSLSNVDVVRYCYFNFYRDINPDTFVALLGVNSSGLFVDGTTTAETEPGSLTEKNRSFSYPLTGGILIILPIILYLFFFVWRNEFLTPSADSAGNPQDDSSADRAEKTSKYLYNNLGVDIKFLYAVDTQGVSRLLGYLSAGNGGYFDIAVSEYFVGCDRDGARYVVLNNSDEELFINFNNAVGRC